MRADSVKKGIAKLEDEVLVATPQTAPRKYKIKPFFILIFIYFYLAGFYGVYLAFTSAKWTTVLFSKCILVLL